MPQNPLVPRYGGASNALNLTATTVVKAAPGTVFRVIVNTAPSAAGGVYDANAASGNTAENLIASLSTAGVVDLTFPCKTGILVAPGTGGVVSVSYQ